MRFFITPKMKKGRSPVQQLCWRLCGEQNVGHTHVFWDCTKITRYWNDVWKEMGKILGYELPKTCTALYLGNVTRENIQDKDWYLIKILLAASKKAITRRWHKEDPPTWRNCTEIIDEIHVMERLTHIIKLQQSLCESRWEKWTVYKKQHKD